MRGFWLTPNVPFALGGTGGWTRRPMIRPVLFGSRQRIKLSFAAEDLGVVAPRRPAELYRSAQVGIVFSLTPHSRVAQEMMAGGLPVVELASGNVGTAPGASGDIVGLATYARAFVEARTWESAGDQLAAALPGPRPWPRLRA